MCGFMIAKTNTMDNSLDDESRTIGTPIGGFDQGIGTEVSPLGWWMPFDFTLFIEPRTTHQF